MARTAQRATTLSDFAEKVLTIVRKKYKLKDKKEAMNFVIETYGHELLDLEFKPSFIRKMKRIEKEHESGKAKRYTSIEELRRDLEQT